LKHNIEDIVNRTESDGFCNEPRRAKKYLIYKFGNKCSICNINSWMGKSLLLILDHIDGNSSNWELSNLRLLCSNCDSQLPTYKKRNVGNGRFSRKQRYQNGQSF